MLLSTLIALSSPAHAIVALRLGAGMGTSTQGAAGRFGLEADVYPFEKFGVGARAALGVDGMDGGANVALFELGPNFRLIGGGGFAIVACPHFGMARLTPYKEGNDVPDGPVFSASLFAGPQAQILLINLSAGARLETYGFREFAVTGNVAVGIGF